MRARMYEWTRSGGMGIAALGLIASMGTTVRGQESVPPNWDKLNATFDANGAFDHDPSDKVLTATVADLQVTREAPADNGTDGPSVASTAGGCPESTIVPGNMITYNPPLRDTSGVLTLLCQPSESCDGASGTSKSVFYYYVPDRSGLVEANTFGSNFDTVLSVFDGCAVFCGFGCCEQPVELGCNNNAPLSQQSQLYVEVEAGQPYVFKVASLGSNAPGGLLDFNLRWIPGNQICQDAKEIIGTTYEDNSVPTFHATIGLCEAQESCEFNNVGVSNSVFYRFTAPCDGFINANTNDSTYDTVLSVWDGCGEFQGIDAPCLVPNELACDDDAGIGLNSQVFNVPVSAGETYFIKVSDYNTSDGGGWLFFHFQFVGADPPVTEIAMPDALACVCDQVAVEGTAAANGSLSTYTLEYRAVNGGAWSLIETDTAEVTDGTLGTFITGALPSGYYHLRLTAENHCGLTSTDVQTVFVDQGFDTVDLRFPVDMKTVGGDVCIDGTVWDRCFDSYQVEFAPLNTANFQPVDPNSPEYNATVTNDPLADWDTAGNVADGDYSLRVAGTDICGHSASVTIGVTIDNTPPVAEIKSPERCECHEGLLEVIGTVDDANLGSWVLQYAGGNTDTWTNIGSGTGNVFQDTLGTLNLEALEPCPVTLRLIAVDATVVDCVANKRFSEHVVTIDTGVCGDHDFDTDNDGDVDLFDYGVFVDEYTGP